MEMTPADMAMLCGDAMDGAIRGEKISESDCMMLIAKISAIQDTIYDAADKDCTHIVELRGIHRLFSKARWT